MQTGARKRTSERLRAEANIPGRDSSSLTAGLMLGGRFALVRALDRNRRIWTASDAANRTVVLKTGTRSSIEREYRVLSALNHRNIVGAIGRIEDGHGAFIILDYLEGGDLVSLAGLSPRHWLGPIGDVVDALGYLHRQNLVHRDLKARNVLLDTADRACLVDFESALAIGSRWTAGGATPSIVRPERGDRPVAVADDLYALACLLHEMLYGGPPGTTAVKPIPAAIAPLASLVETSLAATGASTGPDLRRYAAVVELLQAQNPDSE